MPNAQCRSILTDGLRQLQLSATDQQIQQWLDYIALLRRWNKAYNLTAIDDPQAMARLHILDSLAVQAYVLGPRVIDIGTGAGLPGIPLAIFLPQMHFTLLDSNAKKTRFVQQAKLELALSNIDTVHHRAESYQPQNLYNSVISRAYSDISSFLNSTGHLLADQGIFLAMKGQKPVAELQQLNRQCSCIEIQVPGLEAERCLISIAKQ